MKTYLLGKFWHPDHVTDALTKLREIGVKAQDVFSPFPIHEIEPLLDIKRTRLLVASFIYGMIGMLSAVILISILYGVVWPVDIGGKPHLPLPDYVPIAFEATVFFAAHGVIITFFIVSGFFPGRKAILMDDRQTDDVFVIAINEHEIAAAQTDEVKSIMTGSGAYEITTKSV